MCAATPMLKVLSRNDFAPPVITRHSGIEQTSPAIPFSFLIVAGVKLSLFLGLLVLSGMATSIVLESNRCRVCVLLGSATIQPSRIFNGGKRISTVRQSAFAKN
ncbi:hypothetical protein D3C78_1110460 [compost metagenome]